MTAVAFPIAATAEAALARPLGRAARESQAVMLAGEAVAFVTEPVGPVFSSREAAMDAYAILQHGVSLGTLIARVIHQSTGIDLTPRTVKDPTPGAAVDATTVQIGPGAPRV